MISRNGPFLLCIVHSHKYWEYDCGMLLVLHSFVAKSSCILPPLVVVRWCCWGLFFSASLLLLAAGFDLWLAHTPLISFFGSGSFFCFFPLLPQGQLALLGLFVSPVPNRRLIGTVSKWKGLRENKWADQGYAYSVFFVTLCTFGW